MSISINGASSSSYDLWELQIQKSAQAKANTTTKLTKEESAYDTDGDGVLSATEKKAYAAALAESQSSSKASAPPQQDGGPNSAEAQAAAAATQVNKPTDGGALGNRGGFSQGDPNYTGGNADFYA